MSKAKKLWIVLALLTACLILPPLVAPSMVPWSEMNCEHQEINVKTGQARFCRCLWFIPVSRRVEDTPLSKALGGETVNVADIDPWRRVNTFSPGTGHSPHYQFHAAFHQIGLLEDAFEESDASGEERKAVAEEVLRLWQISERAPGADSFIDEVVEGGIAKQ